MARFVQFERDYNNSVVRVNPEHVVLVLQMSDPAVSEITLITGLSFGVKGSSAMVQYKLESEVTLSLETRLAALEKNSHEPYDFTDLIRRIERLEHPLVGMEIHSIQS